MNTKRIDKKNISLVNNNLYFFTYFYSVQDDKKIVALYTLLKQKQLLDIMTKPNVHVLKYFYNIGVFKIIEFYPELKQHENYNLYMDSIYNNIML